MKYIRFIPGLVYYLFWVIYIWKDVGVVVCSNSRIDWYDPILFPLFIVVLPFLLGCIAQDTKRGKDTK